MLAIATSPAQAAPKVTNAAVKLELPQHGLHGAHPWTTVTWWSSTLATTQVEFWADDGLTRRTPLDTQLVKTHTARIELLRPGNQYRLEAVSSDASGRCAESMAEQRRAVAHRGRGWGATLAT